MVNLFDKKFNVVVEGTSQATADKLRLKIAKFDIPRYAKHITDAASQQYSIVGMVDYSGTFYNHQERVNPDGIEEILQESFDSGNGLPRIIEKPRTIFVFHEVYNIKIDKNLIHARVFRNRRGEEHYKKQPPKNFALVARIAMQLMSDSDEGEVYKRYIKPYLL